VEEREVRVFIAAVWFLGVCLRKSRREGVGPRPKPLTQTRKNRVDKWAVGMVGEKGLEERDVDGGLDGEKVGM
jgi:hypothetical protein